MPTVPLTDLGKNNAFSNDQVGMIGRGLHRLRRSYSRIEAFLVAEGGWSGLSANLKYAPNSNVCPSIKLSGSNVEKTDTILANRLPECTSYALGVGERYPFPGTLRQMKANQGCDGNTSERDVFSWVVSSGISPNSRENVSGTTCNFPGLCSTVKSKVYKAIA